MIEKLWRHIRAILAIYFSRQILICISELRRIVSAPRLISTLNTSTATIVIPTADHPHNGSVLLFENKWFVAVRIANVSHSKFLRRLEIEGGPSRVDSRTWLVEVDKDFHILDQCLLSDASVRDPDGLAKNGLTDPRLFEWQGEMWALWSAERVTTNDWSDISNTMALGVLRNGDIEQFTLLASPHNRRREKNWMPWVINAELRLIYEPASLETYRLVAGELQLVNKSNTPDPRLLGYSGSSQVHPWGEDWIYVVHYAARATRMASAQLLTSFYLHRLVIMTTDFKIKSISREFFFEQKATEFCAGIVVEKDTVVFSYGLGDSESRVMRVPRNEVEGLFPA